MAISSLGVSSYKVHLPEQTSTAKANKTALSGTLADQESAAKSVAATALNTGGTLGSRINTHA